MSYYFGLYFGNTNLCLAVHREGNTEVIANAAGDRVTPAFVSFSNGEKLVGLPAVQGMVRNAVNTMTYIKSLINAESDVIEKCKCKVIEEGDRFFYQIQSDEINSYLPSEALGSLFKVMADIAKNHCHESDIPAVITVPLDFSSTDIVSSIASDAGFRVLRVISEPSAATLAYEIGQSPDDPPCHCLVYRMGGTSVDVTILHVVRGIYRVLTNVKRKDLGGHLFTSLIADFCSSQFKRQYKGADISESKRAVIKLHTAAENCKHVLSTLGTAQCFSESIYDGIDLSIEVSRARFDSLIGSLLRQCLEPVAEALKEANLTEENIGKLVLAGGSCKIPKLQQYLMDMFPSTLLLNNISPDEVIAVGAAKQAEINSESDELLESDSYVKVLSHGISAFVISDTDTLTVTLFPEGTPIPACTSQSLTLANPISHIDIFEDTGKVVNKGIHLAKLLAPADTTKHFVLNARLSKDGVLSISCNDVEANVENSLTVMPKSD